MRFETATNSQTKELVQYTAQVVSIPIRNLVAQQRVYATHRFVVRESPSWSSRRFVHLAEAIVPITEAALSRRRNSNPGWRGEILL